MFHQHRKSEAQKRGLNFGLKRKPAYSDDNSFYCIHCGISLNSEYAVRSHASGRKHIRNKRSFRDRFKYSSQDCITVREYPDDTLKERIFEYFSKFGMIKNLHMALDFVIVQYFSEDVIDQIMSEPRVFMDKELKIENRTLEEMFAEDNLEGFQPAVKQPKKNPLTAQVPAHTTLMNAINHERNFIASIHDMVSRLELKTVDINTRTQICKELQDLFKPFFPGCSVSRFGSAASGTGFANSDLDLMMDLNLDYPSLAELYADAHTRSLLHRIGFDDLETIVVDRRGFSVSNLISADKSEIIVVLSRIIKEFSNKKFTINLTLLSAREPIVKFTHNESNIKCDLTLNNRIVLENTKLAKLFLDLNPHVKYLVYIVRYWAKHYGLTGPGALFSTYTIQMLVFFYLQRTNPQIIPNLWQLCEMSTRRNIVDGWDCSFQFQDGEIPPSENEDPLHVLLAGFFTHYSNVNFTTEVLCLRKGSTIGLEQFKQKNMTNSKESSFGISTINIQDPIVLNHNIAQNVNLRSYQKFQHCIRDAVRKFKEKDITMKDGSSLWGMEYLCSNLEYAESTAVPEVLNIEPDKNGIIPGYDYSFTCKLDAEKLRKLFFKLFRPTAELKLQWSMEVYEAIIKILKEALMFDVEVITDRRETIRAMLTPPVPEPGKPITLIDDEIGEQAAIETLVHIRCHTLYRLWNHRRKIRVLLHGSNHTNFSTVTNEIEVSEDMVKNAEASSMLGLHMIVVYENTADSTALRVHFRPSLKVNEFQQFFDYIKPTMRKVVDNYKFEGE